MGWEERTELRRAQERKRKKLTAGSTAGPPIGDGGSCRALIAADAVAGREGPSEPPDVEDFPGWTRHNATRHCFFFSSLPPAPRLRSLVGE